MEDRSNMRDATAHFQLRSSSAWTQESSKNVHDDHTHQ